MRPVPAALGPGFALAADALIGQVCRPNNTPARTTEIEKSRGPYKASAVAEAARSPYHRPASTGERVAEVRRNRERLAERLGAEGTGAWPVMQRFLDAWSDLHTDPAGGAP